MKKYGERIIEYIKKHKYVDFFVILGLSLCYFLLLLDDNIFYMAHDIVFHISNIKVIASEISLNNIIPGKIMPELVNNLGYGVNLFYPMFPHLVGAYFYKLLGDIVVTFKVLDLIIINLSGIAMYKYVEKVFKSRKSSLLSSVMYVSMPYLFADVFIRCALNESFLFFIIPLIFLGIHYLIDDNNKFMFYLLFVLGYVMAINTHLVLSVYLTIVILMYLLIFRKKVFKWKVIKEFIIASIFIILLVLNFIVPMLEHYNLGIYDIFNISYDSNNPVKTTYLYYYFLPIRHTDIPIYIPTVVIIILVYFVSNLKKIKNIKVDDKKVLLGMGLIMLFSFILATSDLIWNLVPNIFKNIQFGWRMSLFVSISVSVIFGYVFRVFDKKHVNIFLGYFIVLLAVSNFFNSFMTVRVSKDSELYLEETYNRPRWEQEYLPVDAVDNFLNIRQVERELVVIEGDADIEVISNSVPDMEFMVNDIDSEEILIEIPRIYYLGYELVDNKGKSYDIVLGDDGFINTTLSKDGKYKLVYKGTKLNNIANLVVMVSLILFIIYLVILRRKVDKNGDK